MNQNTIENIIYYLKSSTFSPETTKEEHKFINKNIYKFTIYKDCLYMLQPNDIHCLKKVLNKDQAKKSLYTIPLPSSWWAFCLRKHLKSNLSKILLARYEQKYLQHGKRM
jgi:hypothetical protein